MPISDNVTLGRNVIIFQSALVNLYGCAIGDDSKIGAFVEIQKGAAIGQDFVSSNERISLDRKTNFIPSFREVPARSW